MELYFSDDQPSRLDIFLADKLPDFTRSYLIKKIKDSSVRVNDRIETKSGFLLKKNSKVSIELIKPIIKEIDLKIIYQDDDVIVIDKPAGILSHAKGLILDEATVSSWVIDKTTDLFGNKAGIVHRLDRATSGVMILALNQKAQLFLQKQFSTRKVKKTYFAVVEGIPALEQAVIDIPIKRNSSKPKQFKTDINGKSAQTEYRVIKTNYQKNLSLLELSPKTGRTHQLRVHLKYLKTPIAGDYLYNQETAAKYTRMYLHAYSLEIDLPNGSKSNEFIAELPIEFETLL